MGYPNYQHDQGFILDGVHDAVLTDADALEILRALQFQGTSRPGIVGQVVCRGNDPPLHAHRQFTQGLVRRWFEDDDTGHVTSFPVAS